MISTFRYRAIRALLIVGALLLAGGVAYANHAWGNYHWARQSNPFNLKLGDNVSTVWDASLSGASSDWSKSTVLDTTIVAGGTRPRNCRPTSGRVEVCSASYGNNGWLGLASIWVSGSHITQGAVKVNDYYFSFPKYNTSAWRNSVMCQEIGHTFGLAHQDENFNNPPLGSCMDYSDPPDQNQHPNQHDYDQLELIYAHLDSTTTVGQSALFRGNANIVDEDVEGPPQWGKVIKKDAHGRPSLFERDLGKGRKVFTFVIWADVE